MPPIKKELIGKRFGKLTVISEDSPLYYNFHGRQVLKRRLLCKCDCGKEVSVNQASMVRGSTRSCGCKVTDANRKNAMEDLTGRKFGRLLITGEARKRNYNTKTYKHSFRYWNCICDCGKQREVAQGALIRGTTRACGCLQKEAVSKSNTKDLTNKKTGQLLVLYKTTRISSHGYIIWHCRCDCGKEIDRSSALLSTSRVHSCGCRRWGATASRWNPKLTRDDRCDRRIKFEYKQWRTNVFVRDKCTCQICGKTGRDLVAHHLDGFRWNKEGREVLTNGVILCKKCHLLFHKKYGFGNNTKSQYVLFTKEIKDGCENRG